MAKQKTDDQIATILDQHIQFTTGYADSKLSKERTRILEYYDGTLPARSHKGNSSYVSQDVFESVEAMKATILEVFCTNNKIIEFTPSDANDVEAARIATEACSYYVFRANDGLTVLDEVLEDGLLARVGIAQYSWEEYDEESEEQVGPATMHELASHPAIAEEKTSVDSLDDHQDGTYTANITRRSTKGHVCINAVPPEDFLITARAKDVKTAKLCAVREAKTRGELLEEGYPEDIVDLCQSDSSEMMLDQDKAARFGQLDTQRPLTDDTEDLDKPASTYTIYKCYAKLDVEGTGIPKLWYVVKCGAYVLEKKKVSYKPFAVFDPIHKAHSALGNSFANKVVPVQNAKTVLTRSILDHAVITNSPRWKVVKGALMNPKEMMDNRVGGIVNVTRPDGIEPLEQAALNPFIFQTIQMMDANKEDTTGQSRLSKGLNRDAISTQNSQGLVEDLVSLADRRAKIIARRFSLFLQQLYLGVYQLILDHQDYETVLEVAGNYVPVDPRQWKARTLVTADISVGYGEQDKEAAKLQQVDQYLSQPRLAAMYTPDKQFNVVTRALEKFGFKDIGNFVNPPDPKTGQYPPPQPDPEKMAEVALKQATAEAAKITAQATLERVQFERAKWEHEYDLKKKVENARTIMQSDTMALKERTQVHRENVDAAEIALQKYEVDKAATVSATAFTKPNG